MTFSLPSNPSTISDTRAKANAWTPETVAAKYKDRPVGADLVKDVNRDLDELLTWDNYERKTCEVREATKAALRGLIGL